MVKSALSYCQSVLPPIQFNTDSEVAEQPLMVDFFKGTGYLTGHDQSNVSPYEDGRLTVHRLEQL